MKIQKPYEELIARGVGFATPPLDSPWSCYAIFKDLDGNKFVMSAA